MGGQVTVQAQGLASGAHGFPPPSVPWSSGSQTVLCQLVRNAESLAHPALLNLIRWPWARDPLILPLRGENHCPGKFRPVVGRPQPRDPPPARPSSQPWITLLIRGGDGSTQALGWEGGARESGGILPLCPGIPGAAPAHRCPWEPPLTSMPGVRALPQIPGSPQDGPSTACHLLSIFLSAPELLPFSRTVFHTHPLQDHERRGQGPGRGSPTPSRSAPGEPAGAQPTPVAVGPTGWCRTRLHGSQAWWPL